MASEVTVRCRKCRKILITHSDSLINSHGEKHNGGKARNDGEISDCTITSERSCLFISEDSYPQFITDALDESSWTKGKLNCPGCQARIGSFNYVSGNHCTCGSHIVPQVHLLISKVDIRRPSEALPSPVSYPDRPVALTTTSIESLTIMSSAKPSTSDCSGSDSLPSPASHLHCTEESSISVTSQDKQQRKSIYDSTEDPNGELSSSYANESPKKKKQAEARQRHLYEELVDCDDTNICEFSNNSSNFQVLATREQDSEDESNERTPKNDDIPLHMTCSVCLDLLYSPFIAQPCNHVFCEPCLRRLARRNPTRTFCPLCRQIIGQCLPSRDLAAEVREKFPDMYQERHEFEQNHNTQHIPLPWLRNFRMNQQDPYGGSLVRMVGGWKPILWMLTVNIVGIGGLAFLKWYLNSQKNNDGENIELKKEADEL